MNTPRVGRDESLKEPPPKVTPLRSTKLLIWRTGTPLLLSQLQDQEQVLTHAYMGFAEAAQQRMSLSGAAEWMLDNFYVVQQAIRQIREDLPPGYYRQLPKLQDTAWSGYPRIYSVAREIIAQTNSRLDFESLIRSIEAYQETTASLTMGELWAFPTMLRLGILDSLASILLRVTQAEATSERFASSSVPSLDTVADPSAIIGDCITNLRTIATQEWMIFFERVSLVEALLRQDPAGVYPDMDPETRNSYRQTIERLARSCAQDEAAVAAKAIALSQSAPAASDARHIGYYLIDVGRHQLEASLGYRLSWLIKLARGLLNHPTQIYLGTISFLTFALLALLVGYAAESGGTDGEIIVAGILILLPTTAIAVNLVNWIITIRLPPRLLPRMDFQNGIPAEYRTMVVIPALLVDREEVDALLHQLELHFLRNTDPQLRFALLTDYLDAPRQDMPDDADLIQRVQEGINTLNASYQREGSPFYLFHRKRQWNPSEGCWMGWERKRGKLVELNRLLRGCETTSYTTQVGDLSVFPNIRYVITLDADTILPQDGARRLVATMAHPLNHPHFNEATGRVDSGYAILQPRIEIKPTSANRSLFSRIFAGDIGLDLYTRAVSDIYQDLFGEGSYVGKGIYEVDAFERALTDRVSENTILSHDLLEGIYARAALVTDIIFYEEYPTRYLTHTRRLHRWIRGDWQLLPLLLPTRLSRRSGNQVSKHPPLSLLARDRWKILDNLRRSLIGPALLALLVAAWLGLAGSPLVWKLLSLGALAVPLLTSIIIRVIRPSPTATMRNTLRPLRLEALRWLLAVTFLAYEAFLAVDAIVITLIRVYITRKQLLQWTATAHTNRLFGTRAGPLLTWRRMVLSPLAAVLIGALIAALNPTALPLALPILLMWFIAPQVAYQISRPTVVSEDALTADQETTLRYLARQTWFFFEQVVGPEDHWLPPDHFQESPRGVIAHRTSPTNIGLLLLSTLAAYDLGYTGHLDLIVRLQATFETLGRLERHRGHLFNWYNTQTLEVLLPRYVSTVDSGNWAACLPILRQACLAFPDAYVMRPRRWQGLLDTLALLEKSVEDFLQDTPVEEIYAFRTHLTLIQKQIQSCQSAPEKWASTLSWLNGEAWAELSRLMVNVLESESAVPSLEKLTGLRIASERVHHHIMAMQRDTELLMPWLLPLSQPPALFTQPDVDPDLAAVWQDVMTSFSSMTPRLGEIGSVCQSVRTHLQSLQDQLKDSGVSAAKVHEAEMWCSKLAEALNSAPMQVHALLSGYQELAEQAEEYLQALDFKFLFNPTRKVFHIGYNVTTAKLDDNYYDLLASEARLASLLAIAKGDVPQSHWLYLGRPVTQVENRRVLLSWSGTMFEYLMPSLFTANYEHTFLAQSCRTVVDHQIAYSRAKKVPWGISESAYYAFDSSMNYQYRAFGVPGLGYKRGLDEDLVIAPYASILALPFRPQAVLQNIAALDASDLRGIYGYYEAADYTRIRLPLHQDHAVVRAYMAHHQGMIMLTLANYLMHNQMIRRFHADPRVQSVELLLQEKIPDQAPIENLNVQRLTDQPVTLTRVPLASWTIPVDTPMPQVSVLSNGRYSTVITNSGSGYSQWDGIRLTRWQPDTTLDNWGNWVYLQDLDDQALWSATHQPLGTGAESEGVHFYPHQVKFHRDDHNILLNMDITIAADDVEIRRLTLTNRSDQVRHLRLTSYAEVMLAPQPERHPAFNKLFIESEYLAERHLLLFHRRLRSADEKPIYLGHILTVNLAYETGSAYESDRRQFLGRGQTVRTPGALRSHYSGLSKTAGATLDPVMALGQDLVIEPHATIEMAYLTFATGSHEQAVALADRYSVWSMIEGAFDSARRRSELLLTNLEMGTVEMVRIQQILSVLLYPFSGLRASQEILAANTRGQSGLWAYGISGDYPILLVQVDEISAIGLVRELLRAHAFWREQQLSIDLVILNLHDSGYSQELQSQLFRTITRANSADWQNRRGGIFVLNADHMSEVDCILLRTAARAIFDGNEGPLDGQMANISLSQRLKLLPAFTPLPALQGTAETTPPLARPTDLRFDNGQGGFSPDGKEYVIYLKPGQWTPAPWVNVIANETFGCLVSETGLGYSWAENSGENRLTPWRNDPVSDTPGEALYLRDEETAQVWSPTPLPSRDSEPYLIRHGAGYSLYQHHSQGLKQFVQVFVVPDAPVKIVKLRLENTWDHARRITVTYYAEWVLGAARDISQAYVISEFDHDTEAMLARNAYNAEFGTRVAFLAANKTPHGLTADRTEFLGRMGCLSQPAALSRIGLASTLKAGIDPCAALQLHVDLPPHAAEEVFFLLGQGIDKEQSLQLIRRYKDPAQVEIAWQATGEFWDRMLGTITVHTPEPSMDFMLNRWLLYQTLSCRIWGRSGFYQSSGAFGYRDQLQDVLSLTQIAPSITREQILRAARHQFEEGDVLHWWHPPSGRGIRTRCSDDMLWLPFVTVHYIEATGDTALLKEQVPFVHGEILQAGEDERYAHYETTSTNYSLYEHCLRAIKRGSTTGAHELPLIGTGDWNDGMNRVGMAGQGESVWVGWFLYRVLTAFAPLCVLMDQSDVAESYREQAQRLKQALETSAWDGHWYRRAYFDDGTPLGSVQNREAQIDSIVQSWAVLSGAGEPEHAQQAMDALYQHLICPDDQVALLFTPPFDRTLRDPGYVKGYPPGIRENGGQYTHGAVWAAWAFAQLGQANRAAALFKMLNPISHSDTAEKAGIYRVEPYVMAADVYSTPPHMGQGGWTWYTGSASWMYRLGIEMILGIKRNGDMLHIDPIIPNGWMGFDVSYRNGDTTYTIHVHNPHGINQGVLQTKLDDSLLPDAQFPLLHDGHHHVVQILMGS